MRFNPTARHNQKSPMGEIYSPAGRCTKCNRTVFVMSDERRKHHEPDPRGFAGPEHSLATLEEFPAVKFCWDCLNEQGYEGQKVCIEIARQISERKGGES